jgi:hypothetical protein
MKTAEEYEADFHKYLRGEAPCYEGEPPDFVPDEMDAAARVCLDLIQDALDDARENADHSPFMEKSEASRFLQPRKSMWMFVCGRLGKPELMGAFSATLKLILMQRLEDMADKLNKLAGKE